MELQLNLENINVSNEKLKKILNIKQKLENKPWITKEILKSIKNKNKQNKKMCQTKDLT